jgi:hypothetical protein
MKKIKYLLLTFIIAMLALDCEAKRILASDTRIRSHVVMIKTKKGSCTGEAVRAASGRVVMLTAAHCRELLIDGQAEAVREDGSTFITSVLAFDPTVDLMVMTTPETTGLRIAKSARRHEHVHAITHGMGHDSYRSDGELLEILDIDVGIGMAIEASDINKCKEYPNQRIELGPFGIPYCVAKLHNEYSTMPVAPGSSGGAVLNDAGEVLGIVSTSGGEGFSTMVPLPAIKAMLARY